MALSGSPSALGGSSTGVSAQARTAGMSPVSSRLSGRLSASGRSPSGLSSRRVYEKGQFSIPSDTACYPAKIMHGHMEVLLERGVDAVVRLIALCRKMARESDRARREKT